MEQQNHKRENAVQNDITSKKPSARAGDRQMSGPSARVGDRQMSEAAAWAGNGRMSEAAARAGHGRMSEPVARAGHGRMSEPVARAGEGRMAKAAGKKRELRSNYLQRSHHHDYCRPARYMITLVKSPKIGALSRIIGNPKVLSPHENAPKTELLADGRHVVNAMGLWLKQYPELRVRRYVIMPDHVHMCLQVMGYIRIGLGSIIGNFMGKCSRLRHDALYPKVALPTVPASQPIEDEDRHERTGSALSPIEKGDTQEQLIIEAHSASGGYDGRSVEIEPFFERGFNDRIAYNDSQWERQHRYVDDNPRRLLIKRQHPDLYFKKWLITTDDGQNFIAQGNIMLLRNPDLQVVRFSRRFSETFYATCVENWEKCVENNGVLVSPFIHPKEREIRDWALSNGGEIIRICENGFGDRFTPQGKEFEYIGTSKLLLIAPLEHNTKRDDMTRAKAMSMNAIAQSIASIDWLAGKGVIKVM